MFMSTSLRELRTAVREWECCLMCLLGIVEHSWGVLGCLGVSWGNKTDPIFCYFFKKGVFAKTSWLNFLANNVFTRHSKLLTILLKSFLAIFAQR